jgi:exosortase
MNKKIPLPFVGFEIEPHEAVFLGFLFVAFKYSMGEQYADSRGSLWLYSVAVLAGIGVLIWRCREEWKVLPNKLFFFGLAGCWVLLFSLLGNSVFAFTDSWAIFGWMFFNYNIPSTDAQYALFMPFVILALFYWKRKTLVAKPLEAWTGGLWLFAAGLAMHVMAFLIQQPKFSTIGFFLGLFGLMGLAWGKNWLKASLFPFFLLAFCVPLGGAATFGITMRLRLLVSWIVEHIAHLGLAPDLIRDGTQLFDAQHTFGYDVVAACSGIRSLMTLLVLTTIYGFVCFKLPWQRAVLIAAAMPLAVLGNVCRLCFTIGVAELFGQNAGKAVETDAGFITFLVALICVFFISNWLERFNKDSAPSEKAVAV